MANVTYNDHATDNTPASTDLVPYWDVAAGAAKKATRIAMLGGLITGSGTIATGGFTGTLPATGTLALLSAVQTFTAIKNFSADIGVGTTTPGTNIVGTYDYPADSRIAEISGANYGRVIVKGAVNAAVDLVDTGAGANEKWSTLYTVNGVTGFESKADDGATQSANIMVMDHSSGLVGFGTATPDARVDAAPTATGVDAMLATMPASTTRYAFRATYNGVDALIFAAQAAATQIGLSSRDFGNNVAGPSIAVNRNTNAAVGTVGPAPGAIALRCADNATNYIWADDSDKLRIHTAAPTGNTGAPTVNANSAGAVVGDQTSMLEAKALRENLSDIVAVITRVYDGAAAVRRFAYRDGAYSGQEFEGVVTDFAPEYGKDRDSEHPQGKALNEIQILGDLLRAVANLTDRVAALEAAM